MRLLLSHHFENKSKTSKRDSNNEFVISKIFFPFCALAYLRTELPDCEICSISEIVGEKELCVSNGFWYFLLISLTFAAWNLQRAWPASIFAVFFCKAR